MDLGHSSLAPIRNPACVDQHAAGFDENIGVHNTQNATIRVSYNG